jgi:hypothetical protein
MHIFEDHTARLQNTEHFQLFEIGPAFDQSLLQAKPASDLHLREIGRTVENTFFDGQPVLKNALGKIDATFESAAHQPRVASDLCVSKINQLAHYGSFDLHPIPVNDAILAASVEQFLKEYTPNHPRTLIRKRAS